MSLPIVKTALYVEVAKRLRTMIGAGELAPGAWLDEQKLAERLGVSRTPLREAIRMLVAEGLVRLEPRRGCFVNELSEQDLDEVFALMAMLEGRCGFEAARKVRAADLHKLETLHQKLVRHAEAGQVDQYDQINRQIHAAIQALAANRWLSTMVDDLRGVVSLSRHKSLTLPGRLAQSCAEHLAIFAALKAGDAEKTETLMRHHLLSQREALRALAQSAAQKTQSAAVKAVSSAAILKEAR